MKNNMNTTNNKTNKSSKSAKRHSKVQATRQPLNSKHDGLNRILESSLRTGTASVVPTNPFGSEEGVAPNEGSVVDAGGIGRTWRLGEQLLNELGMHEGAMDHEVWSMLALWADVNQRREARCMTPGGEFVEQRLQHRLRLPDSAAVDEFLADADVKRLNLGVISNEQLAETLEVRRVTLEGLVEASALELTKLSSTLIRAAIPYGGQYEGYRDAMPKGSAGQSGVLKTNLLQGTARGCVSDEAPSDPKRELKLRAEFLGDAIALRQMLAPFALDWRDVEPAEFMYGTERRVSGWDRDIELTLADGAPGLDDLRWYLNQATDMHVAAESLHYARRYTGERLPHDLVEDMRPKVDVRREMAERLGKMCDAVEAMLERLEHAQGAIVATLPIAQTSAVKRRRQGKRG